MKVDGPLRLLELMSSKIFVIYRPDMNMDHLTNTTQKSYRIEEIPSDQTGNIFMLIFVSIVFVFSDGSGT